MQQTFELLMKRLGRSVAQSCSLYIEPDVRLAWEVYQAAQCHNMAMRRICDGMTAEDMEQAPFTYQSLLQIVQRREDRVPLSELVLPEMRIHDPHNSDYADGCINGWNDAIEDVQQQISQLMEQAK